MDKLDKVRKKFMKKILSLPQTVADPAIYNHMHVHHRWSTPSGSNR